MISTLKLSFALAATLLVATASSVFAGTIIYLPAEDYSIEVSSLLNPSPTVTVSSDGRGIDVQNAFAAVGGSTSVTVSDTFTFRILPDAGRQLDEGASWTAISGGGRLGGAYSYLRVTDTTSSLSGGAKYPFMDKTYDHNWFNSYGFSYSDTWHVLNPPFYPEGFVLEWTFTFGSSAGGQAGVGSIHVQAATVPASTIPDQSATLLLLGFSLIGLAKARRLVGC